MADSVLAVIEVETCLNGETLRKALGQLRPVKALMPGHGTLEMPDGSVVEDPLGGKIVTGVFAFNPPGDIDRQVAEMAKLYPNVADFIVVPGGAGYFAARTMRVCGFAVRDDDVANGYVRYTARGMGLAVIFGLLNSIAAIRKFSGQNCVRYVAGSWADKKPSLASTSLQ
jgi:hypothetical protein